MRVINSQAIPVRPSVVRILGNDHIAAIYFQQLRYYNDHTEKDSEGFFSKSVPTIYRDTVLTRSQQDRARRKLVALGWIAVRQSLTGLKTKLLRGDI